MMMKCKINSENKCFAACTTGARLVSIGLRTARRAPVSENSLSFHLSAGCISRYRDRFESQNAGQVNLTRCEIFRGKVPLRNIETKKYNLETRTQLRQNYE
jgi:hypothetical protein